MPTCVAATEVGDVDVTAQHSSSHTHHQGHHTPGAPPHTYTCTCSHPCIHTCTCTCSHVVVRQVVQGRSTWLKPQPKQKVRHTLRWGQDPVLVSTNRQHHTPAGQIKQDKTVQPPLPQAFCAQHNSMQADYASLAGQAHMMIMWAIKQHTSSSSSATTQIHIILGHQPANTNLSSTHTQPLSLFLSLSPKYPGSSTHSDGVLNKYPQAP